MKLSIIDAGNFMCDGGAVFGVVPKKMWEKQYPCDEENFCNLAMRCLLIDTGDRRILIDTGVGNKQSEKFYSYYKLNGEATLAGSLTKAGYSPGDITDVVLTHLHFDHCGGCVEWDDTQQPKLVFPHADYWVSQDQWDNYLDPNVREGAVYFPENMMPIKEANRLKVVEASGEWLPGVELRLFNGHTPGQIVPVIHYKDKTIAYMGDLIPVAASMPLPWVSAYDVNPLASMKEKETFLEEAAQNGYILFFEHDLYNQCCTVTSTEKGIRCDETFPLSTIL
ncbi:MBL fold metallo-hydrolase [Marinilabiliaceae bacterium JC017]|nr:MBL fold metallo-hydrolase [Marinilabiliaceae bacterium JC017]